MVNEMDVGPKKKYSQDRKCEHSEGPFSSSDKMAIIGFLAASIAHEINNPLGFTRSNLSTASKYLQDICAYVEELKSFVCQVANSEHMSLLPLCLQRKYEKLRDPEREADTEFLIQDFADILQESIVGIDRIGRFVDAFTNFARPGEPEIQWADINQCLESTTSLVRHEIESKAKITLQYRQLDQIKCFPRQLNAMFMRLLLLIVEGIESKGRIQITTRLHHRTVLINISIKGQRIKEKLLSRRSRPLSATLKGNNGKGLGMRPIYGVIQMHKGRIDVLNRSEDQTYYSIVLPYDNGL